MSHESTVRLGCGHPRPEDQLNDKRNIRGPGFDYEDFYLLDHILEAELLYIAHKVIFMRNIHLDKP